MLNSTLIDWLEKIFFQKLLTAFLLYPSFIEDDRKVFLQMEAKGHVLELMFRKKITEVQVYDHNKIMVSSVFGFE